MEDLSSYERRNVGPGGEILLRRNPLHERRCIGILRHRDHPAWSQHRCGLLLEEAAA